MKRFITIFFLLSLIFVRLSAVPAYPKKTPIIVDGDTIYISLKGDENCKFALDEQGYTILPTEKGWYYAEKDESGNVMLSKYRLVSRQKMTTHTKRFLANTNKGIIPLVEREAHGTSHRAADMNHAERNPAIGSRKALIILMQFRDTKFIKSTNDFLRLFNEQGYQEDGAMGSVYDYYQWASYGQLQLTSDVLGPFTAQNNMSYYGGNTGIGGNDRNPYELFSEALEEAVKVVTLSDYDADNDGYVDNIHIIYAGYGEEAGASANAIWAHEMTFRTITIQGMKIDRYSCAPELRGNKGSGISRIGPHCHEIGHALGAMDYYDTDYETGGKYQGTGKWDIMASGSWNNDGIAPADFNPYVKVYNYGWTEIKTLVPNASNVIGLSSEKGNIYRVNTGTANDFFLLENRDKSKFHSAEPGKGLLIFHIGPHLDTRASTNTINSTYPQQCYVVCASSNNRIPSSNASSYGDIDSPGCPYPGTSGNTMFSETSTPAALTVTGKNTGISISGITYQGDNIIFQYGNASGDDTDDPTAPPDEVYLWGEDFEQLRLPSSWVYSDVENVGTIEVVTKLSTNDIPQSPTAKSGKGYARFIAVPQAIIGDYRTSGYLTSPRIKLVEDKNYNLSFAIRKYNNRSSRDVITVTIDGENEDDEEELIKKEIDNQDGWETYTVPIPSSYTDFTLSLFLDIDYHSTLFVDNITISESTETAINNTTYSAKFDRSFSIYTLQGIQHQQYMPGINIIRMHDGSIKKIYVK